MEKVTECKSLLIFGATGTIGKIIVNSILSTKSSFDRVAVFTSPATKKSKGHELELLRHSDVEIILGDIHDEVHVLKAYQGEYRPFYRNIHKHIDREPCYLLFERH